MEKLISIVIPTYNEKKNLPLLVEKIHSIFHQISLEYECIVVDDNSPDGTYSMAQELSQKYSLRPFLRKTEKGLSSAMLYGLHQARGEIVGFIDSDLQHPPELIPELVKAIQDGYKMAVGSRLVQGGGVEEWPWYRRFVSWMGRILAYPLTSIRDTMSGYFFIHRSVAEGVSLRTLGYKLGLEIMVKGKHENKVIEVPYIFLNRSLGESKIGWKTYIAYLCQLFLLYGYKIKKMCSFS